MLLQANISTIWSADGEDYTGCATLQMTSDGWHAPGHG